MCCSICLSKGFSCFIIEASIFNFNIRGARGGGIEVSVPSLIVAGRVPLSASQVMRMLSCVSEQQAHCCTLRLRLQMGHNQAFQAPTYTPEELV